MFISEPVVEFDDRFLVNGRFGLRFVVITLRDSIPNYYILPSDFLPTNLLGFHIHLRRGRPFGIGGRFTRRPF